MELNQLKYFQTVARLGSVTKAAEELFVSQPNLSTSISRLESSLGVQLFTRTKGRIQLTENGTIFLHHVNRMLSELDIAVEEIRQVQEYQEDTINIASSFARILPVLFSHYYVDYGLVPTTQMVLSDEQIERGLMNHTLNLAVVMDWMEGDQIAWEPICGEPVLAVMKADNRFPKRSGCSLGDLRSAHFICNELYLSRNILTRLCQTAGFVPNIVRTSNEQEWFDQRSFDFGRNIVLCPLHMIPDFASPDQKDLRLMRLEDHFARVTIGIAQSKNHPVPPVIEEFRSYAVKELAAILEGRGREANEIISQLQSANPS